MDIHEQVIYQQKLKEDEEKLNIIIEASELGNWELDLVTRQVSYSERYLEILGHKKGEILNHQEIIKHLHPDDLQIREAAFKTAFDTGQLHYETRIIWNDESLHWIEGKGKVFYDEAGKPLKMLGTVRDITEEKNYQQQLKEREEKFRLLADSMPQHIWTADTAGNLNYFNQSVYDYSGLTPEQINTDGWIQIVHPEDREKNITEWLNSVSTGKDFLFEHRFRRYDGEYRWQLSRAIPQRDAAGNIQMWVGTSTDIQEIKEQDQQKDFFISMASHELKTPITSIKGYVQLLQSSYAKSDDGFLKKSLAVIDKQVLTLTTLISDLLDVSKIKSGSLVLNKQEFEISIMMQEVVAHIQHINPDYSIHISDTGALVYADRERIGQVLINFLTNAVKYSPNSKEIIVKNFIEDDHVVVSVHDSGIGINKANQEKIFERFYRVEGKDEKTYPGFGIGLFICAQIIERHQGKIGVTSEPGKGSVFYFSIPLSK
jgi:PAS domain S-box-containing protein